METVEPEPTGRRRGCPVSPEVITIPAMADWTDPRTWREVAQYSSALSEISKKVSEAQKQRGQSPELELLERVLDVLKGHQKGVTDMSHVTGKLVAYTTAAHEQRVAQVETLKQLVKSVGRIEKSVAKLAKRVGRVEERLSHKPR